VDLTFASVFNSASCFIERARFNIDFDSRTPCRCFETDQRGIERPILPVHAFCWFPGMLIYPHLSVRSGAYCDFASDSFALSDSTICLASVISGLWAFAFSSSSFRPATGIGSGNGAIFVVGSSGSAIMLDRFAKACRRSCSRITSCASISPKSTDARIGSAAGLCSVA